jgi:hypothetical protein
MSAFGVKNANIFAKFLVENTFNIITSTLGMYFEYSFVLKQIIGVKN